MHVWMAVLITDLLCQIVNHIVSIINKLQAPRKISSVHISYCALYIEIYENVDIVVFGVCTWLSKCKEVVTTLRQKYSCYSLPIWYLYHHSWQLNIWSTTLREINESYIVLWWYYIHIPLNIPHYEQWLNNSWDVAHLSKRFVYWPLDIWQWKMH